MAAGERTQLLGRLGLHRRRVHAGFRALHLVAALFPEPSERRSAGARCHRCEAIDLSLLRIRASSAQAPAQPLRP